MYLLFSLSLRFTFPSSFPITPFLISFPRVISLFPSLSISVFLFFLSYSLFLPLLSCIFSLPSTQYNIFLFFPLTPFPRPFPRVFSLFLSVSITFLPLLPLNSFSLHPSRVFAHFRSLIIFSLFCLSYSFPFPFSLSILLLPIPFTHHFSLYLSFPSSPPFPFFSSPSPFHSFLLHFPFGLHLGHARLNNYFLSSSGEWQVAATVSGLGISLGTGSPGHPPLQVAMTSPLPGYVLVTRRAALCQQVA